MLRLISLIRKYSTQKPKDTDTDTTTSTENCPQCGNPITDPQESYCPKCAYPLHGATDPDPHPLNTVKAYFRTVWQAVFHPREFFKTLPIRGGYTGPLVFALVSHWIGRAGEFLWQTSTQRIWLARFEQLFRSSDIGQIESLGREADLNRFQDQLTHWFWGAGSVIADPFLTLLSIFVTAAFVFVGARLFITPGRGETPSEISYESAVRVVAYGMTPAILAAVPFVGTFAASVGTLAITVIAAKEIYRVDWFRAIVVGLFPKVLVVGLFLGALAFAVFAFFWLFAVAA